MAGSTYISDPRIWKSFYKNMIDGKFKPTQYKGRQTGRRIGNMYAKKPYMIPVNRHVSKEPEIEQVIVGKQITPVTTVEERAKTEMKEAIQEDMPHVPASIKRPTRRKSVSMKSRLKKKGSKKMKIRRWQSRKSFQKSLKAHHKKRKTTGRRSGQKKKTKPVKSRKRKHSDFGGDSNDIFSKKNGVSQRQTNRNWAASRIVSVYCPPKSGGH